MQLNFVQMNFQRAETIFSHILIIILNIHQTYDRRRQPIFIESLVYFEHAKFTRIIFAEIIVVRMGETVSTCILSLNSQHSMPVQLEFMVYAIRLLAHITHFPLHFSNVQSELYFFHSISFVAVTSSTRFNLITRTLMYFWRTLLKMTATPAAAAEEKIN